MTLYYNFIQLGFHSEVPTPINPVDIIDNTSIFTNYEE
jgi:hypothetical protein